MKYPTVDTENLTKACGTVLLIDRECTGKMGKLHHILVNMEGNICKSEKMGANDFKGIPSGQIGST